VRQFGPGAVTAREPHHAGNDDREIGKRCELEQGFPRASALIRLAACASMHQAARLLSIDYEKYFSMKKNIKTLRPASGLFRSAVHYFESFRSLAVELFDDL
jgi:hypothetical protein